MTLAAWGKVDITPSVPVMLGGYAGRRGQTADIADPLEANVLLLRDGPARLVIVTLDSLYPGKPLRELLLGGLGLKEEELFLSASHTHWAPMMAPDMPGLGDPDPNYIVFVAERLLLLIHDLDKQYVEVGAGYHAIQAAHAANRRLMRLRLTRRGLRYEAGMAPNPEGEKDEEVRVLKLCCADRTVAILWNYSCHPTGYPIPDRVTAEYPGVVRAALREVHGDIPVLFFLGFAGDVRPPFQGLGKKTAKSVIMRLVWGPRFRTPSLAEWTAWAREIAGSVLRALETTQSDVPLTMLVARRLPIPDASIGTGGAGDQMLTWHIVDLGGFVMAGINAEPVAAYRNLLASAIGKAPLFTVGYLDQTYAYLPVDPMLQQGGYEVEGFRKAFGYSIRFRPGVTTGVMAPLKARTQSCLTN